MNILITGASGLIGTGLTSKLLDDGHSIVGLSRTAQPANDLISWIQHDLVKDPISKLAIPFDVDVVYHLAGQTSTYIAKDDPLADLSANVTGFITLLEYFRKLGTKPFIVHAGTATEVGLTNELPINEKMCDTPITFYDISKLTAEKYLKQYIHEGWLKGCTLRLANVYGRSNQAQQSDRGIIDKVYARALCGEKITIFGTGDYLRDYIYIDDVVSAFAVTINNVDALNGGTFNISSGYGITLKQAFLKVMSVAQENSGTKSVYEHVEPPEDLSDIEYRNAVIDSSLFTSLTNWKPTYDFEAGIRATYQSV